jgi:hypothetical protein
MNILFHFKNNDKEALPEFSPSSFSTSYNLMLTLFYLIYDYHRSDKQMRKKEILEKYLISSKNIYTSFFTKTYLLNYFVLTANELDNKKSLEKKQ